jgi:hypothetical protein
MRWDQLVHAKDFIFLALMMLFGLIVAFGVSRLMTG